jgi:hypothetical protein
MTTLHLNSAKQKISQAFQARLAELDDDQTTRATVLLKTDANGGARGQPRTQRQTLLDTIGRSTEKHLPEIDAVLSRYGGQRLADRANVPGYIPVETTSNGIYALAKLPHVKAIIENQAISSLT